MEFCRLVPTSTPIRLRFNDRFLIDLCNGCAKYESWSGKSAQGDKWSFCLTAGTLCPPNQERP